MPVALGRWLAAAQPLAERWAFGFGAYEIGGCMPWFVLPGVSHFRHARVDCPIGGLGLIVLLCARWGVLP